MINFEKYLRRLQVKPQPPSESLLNKLVKSHLKRIPLENLDFYYKLSTDFNSSKILNRIIERSKGGNALQLHTVFFELLRQLGFRCEVRSVQPFDSSRNSFKPRLAHSGVMVYLADQIYYVDLGSIHGLSLPMPVTFNKALLCGTDYFRTIKKPFDEDIYLEKSKDALQFDSYQKIESSETKLIEYLTIYNQYRETNHQENMSRYLFRRTSGGYLLIKNNQFEQMELGHRESKKIENEDEFWSLATQHFGIVRQNILNPGEGF